MEISTDSLRDTPPELGDGRYLVTAKIGEGGMALIYRAWDKRLSKWCAVKLMLPKFGKKRKLRMRFEQEAHTMARLEHKHIIRVYDVDTVGKIPYMVMELAEGGCVIDWVGTYGPMPPRMAIDVTIQLCKGLEASHDAGIIHRDIKPHNMLVNRRGVVKVTDFGIARVDDDHQANLTKTGSVMGTFAYMAPEQRSNAKGVDRRADVYAIGATLYTLVTARTPVDLFVAEHDDSLLDGVNDLLKEVILKACAYKPDDRYDTAMEMAKVLHGLRKHMERTPADAPSLVLRNDELPERPPSDLSAASFPEIAEAFNIDITNPTLASPDSSGLDDDTKSQPTLMPDELDEPADTSMGAPVHQTPVLPYQMPEMHQDFQPGERARRLMDNDAEGLPSYLVGTEEDENSDYYASLRRQQDEAYQRGEDEVTITAPSAPGRESAPIGAAAVDAYQKAKEYDPDAVAKNTHVIQGAESAGKMAADAFGETAAIMMRAIFAPLRIILIPATAILLIMGTTVAVGTVKVGKAHNAALSAHDQYIAEIRNQKALIEDLGAMGIETRALTGLYNESQVFISRQDQFERADKYVRFSKDQFDRYERTAPTSVSHKVSMARKRFQAIDIQQNRYVEALTAWEEVADTTTGRMAVGCHTVSKP